VRGGAAPELSGVEERFQGVVAELAVALGLLELLQRLPELDPQRGGIGAVFSRLNMGTG
jgi:hypothetical protein